MTNTYDKIEVFNFYFSQITKALGDFGSKKITEKIFSSVK